MKVLMILGLIFGVFVIGTALALRYVKNLLGISLKRIKNEANANTRPSAKNDGNIIYQKDDVVVMKGDAKKK
jgi:hypothetical protein